MKLIDPIQENKNLIRHGHVSEKKEINKEERSLVAYGSTKSVDSYQESLLPQDRKSTRLNSSHIPLSRMPSSA